MTLTDRFWSKVAKGSDTDCWRWTGCHNSRGYGCVVVGKKAYLVHRLAYEVLVGPIPDGFTIDHVHERGCRHKDCVNPAHLEAVTGAENSRRYAALITHCPQGHPLDGPNLLTTTAGKRNCRECANARRRVQHPDRRRRENRSPAYRAAVNRSYEPTEQVAS